MDKEMVLPYSETQSDMNGTDYQVLVSAIDRRSLKTVVTHPSVELRSICLPLMRFMERMLLVLDCGEEGVQTVTRWPWLEIQVDVPLFAPSVDTTTAGWADESGTDLSKLTQVLCRPTLSAWVPTKKESSAAKWAAASAGTAIRFAGFPGCCRARCDRVDGRGPERNPRQI